MSSAEATVNIAARKSYLFPSKHRLQG